jgi:hypothetical protein
MTPAHSWVKDKERLTALAHTIDNSVRLYTKDNWFCKTLAVLLIIVTFAWMSSLKAKERYRDFLERFATTIGPLQFFPVGWKIEQVERVVIHESRHTRQARWFGLWIHPWVGLPLYAVFYLLLFLPFGLAFFRALFERDAMKFELRWQYTRGKMTKAQVCERATRFGNTVCSSKYAWALPKRWGVPWFEKVPDQVFKEAA